MEKETPRGIFELFFVSNICSFHSKSFLMIYGRASGI
jgi:hypothetical protein